MKKRIISLILAVVMLSLSLVGCAYSYADDDLASYVTYDESKFKAALLELMIDEGDFTDDPETRAKKVEDAIYALLATNATDKNRYDTEKAGAHDVFYYGYYITFVKDGKTVQILRADNSDTMTTGKVKNIQLGKNIYATTFEEAVNKAALDFEFATDKVLAQTTSGKVSEGQLAAITYTIKYTPAGETAEQKITASRELVVLDPNNPVHNAIIAGTTNIGTEINTVKDLEPAADYATGKFTTKNDVTTEIVIPQGTKITIEKAKVNFVVKNATPFTTITEKSYEEGSKTILKDVFGDEHDVSGLDLTYSVYAYKYSKVDELNAANVINLIYGKNLTKDIVKNMYILLNDLQVDEDAKEEDKKAQQEKQDKFFKDFAIEGFKADEGSTAFDTLVDKLVTALNDLATKKTTVTTAETALSTAQSALTEAEEDVKNNPDSEAAKNALKDAQKDYDSKKEALNKAKTAQSEAEVTRDEYIYILLTKSQTKLDAAKKAWTDATAAEEAAKKAYDDAKKAVDQDNKQDAFDKAEKALEDAKKALEAAQKAEEEAKKAYDDAVKATADAKTAYDNAVADEAAKKTAAEAEGATEDAKKAYETAKTKTTDTKKAYDAAVAKENAAKTKYEEVKAAAPDKIAAAEKAKNDAQTAFDAADAALKAAKETTDDEKKAWDDAKAATEDAHNKYRTPIAEQVVENDNIVNGYRAIKYTELQDAYREEKKNAVVLAVLEAIKKNVKVNSTPEDAVEEAYDRLMNNYKYNFYNGKAVDENGKEIAGKTNYTQFSGNFQDYLIFAVAADYKDHVAEVKDYDYPTYKGEIKDYEDAEAALWHWAQEKVAPVLQFSFIAEKYDLVYTDDEFDDYKDDVDNAYESDEYYYGESAVRNGLQFEKLMDYFLDYEEEKVENAESLFDKLFVTEKYKNIKVEAKAED